MKYIDADKLRADIKRRITDNTFGAKLELMDILSFLDTLPDEPVTDCHELEEEISRTYRDGSVTDTSDIDHVAYENIARHFAEWQKAKMLKDNPVIMSVEDFQALIDSHAKRVEADYKEKMMKDAVEGYVNYYEDSGGILMAEAQVGCPYHNGDKVKIIIVKEEE